MTNLTPTELEEYVEAMGTSLIPFANDGKLSVTAVECALGLMLTRLFKQLPTTEARRERVEGFYSTLLDALDLKH